MKQANSSDLRRRLGLLAALLAAGAAGYLIARFTGSVPASVPAQSPATVAVAVADATLHLPDASLAMMGIATEAAAAGNLSAEINAPGTAMSAAGGQALVNAQAAGTVVRLSKRLGDPVKAGETLAQVESRDAAALAADRSTTEARAALARSALKREQGLFQQGVTPRQDLEAAEARASVAEAEAAQASATAQAAHVSGDGHSLEVRSPIAGRITAANIALGAFVERNTELYRVADPRFVLIEASVTAADAARLRAGDVAAVTTAAGAHLVATVQSVTPTVNEQTRAATVVMTLAPGQVGPLPGEFVQVRIVPKSAGSSGVVIPQDAVQSINGADAVFLRTTDGFKVQTVTVGTRSGGRALILAGLQPGQRIATSNAFLLKSELNKASGDDEE